MIQAMERVLARRRRVSLRKAKAGEFARRRLDGDLPRLARLGFFRFSKLKIWDDDGKSGSEFGQ